MSYVAKRLYSGLLFDPGQLSFHPLIAMVIAIIQFALFAAQKKELLLFILALAIIENIVFHNLKALISTFFALLPVLIFTLILGLIFGGLEIAYLVTVKLLIGLAVVSVFFNHVNPADVGRALETLHIPSSLALIPTLTFTMIPRIAKDVNETIETLKIRGEIKGTFFRWLPKVFAIFIASSIYRSQFLAQSLYFRGFKIGKRTHYKKHPIRIFDLTRLVLWLAIVIIILLDLKFNFIRLI